MTFAQSTLATALFLTFGSNALAMPMPKQPRGNVKIPDTFTANYNFEGIVALDDCSGSLIRFENSKDADHAMVITNGHCLETGFATAGGFTSHQASSRDLNLMDATGNQAADLTATEVIYSTMTTTDITIYQVNETYADILAQFNVRPFTLSSAHPTVGEKIEIVSGYWHRGYSCSIDAFVFNLKEGIYTWNDSLRYTEPGCEVIGGTSGSPIIATGTRNMIAINNTGNENGEKCTDDNPCEVDSAGNITYAKGNNYGEETSQIYSCVNAANEFDLTVAGCQLPH